MNSSKSSAPLVYIILVNWNRFDDTAECISSLNQLTYPNFRIVVIDNGSSDDTSLKLRRQFPQTSLIESNINLGFAAGSNLGIKQAIKQGADYVWLLNNDTIVEPQTLAEMVQAAEGQEVGITGSTILYFNQREKVWAMGGVFNVNTGDARHIQNEHHLPRNSSEELYIPGCSMLVSAQCLGQVGFLDESYFHLGEDVDYCLRARQKGFKLVICRTARVWHKVSTSMTGFSPSYNYYEQRNRLQLIKKFHFENKPLLSLVHLVKRIAIALLMGLRHPCKNVVFIVRGIRDYSKGVTGRKA